MSKDIQKQFKFMLECKHCSGTGYVSTGGNFAMTCFPCHGTGEKQEEPKFEFKTYARYSPMVLVPKNIITNTTV